MDTFTTGNPIKLGSTALEEILCNVAPVGALGELVPHAADSWSIEFPGLSSLPTFEGEPARLKICIATEDIVGPVRNGGIGTTYAALAELLAKLGHDVTILYLKGNEVENGTIEQWIDFYAAKSVRFVPVPNYASIDRFQTGADRWLHAPYNMLKYLTDHPMDVVHVSEWRGSGYLSLLAKRQRLAFQDTLFIVKTSSPWIWNRLYGSQPLDRLDDLAKVHAERRSVEFADMVIGGSLHLLRWMSSQGYRIPRDRTFVHPNVATFDHLADLMNQRQWQRGQRHPIDEIVFFGRLEARKGLFIFVQAIKRLLRQGISLPPQMTFMGKPGARLSARPDQDIVDYIEAETRDWPTKVQILGDFQQYEALQYLLSGARLAVMPSMIENSSLAVYEAAICGIPFIASASGGTPELVAAEDHPQVLCEAHPVPLAEKIEEAVRLGGYVAHPSFDNEANLEQWRRFHLDLGRGLLERLLPSVDQVAEATVSVSVCIYHADSDDKLRATLASVAEQDQPPTEVLIAVDTDDMGSLDRARQVAGEFELESLIVPAFDLDAGQAFNIVADQARGDYLLFLWAGSTIRPMALRALTKVAASSNADLVNYFFRVTHKGDDSSRDHLSAIVFGNVAQSFFRTDVTALPLLVRRETFGMLGGFTTDYRVLAHDHELVAKAQISGVHCETALLELGTVPAWDEDWLKAKCYDQSVAQFRAIRPELAATPLALRELLLMAKGLQKAPARRKGGPAKPKAMARQEAENEGPLGRLLLALSNDMLAPEAPQEAQRPAKPKPPVVKGAAAPVGPRPAAPRVTSAEAGKVKAATPPAAAPSAPPAAAKAPSAPAVASRPGGDAGRNRVAAAGRAVGGDKRPVATTRAASNRPAAAARKAAEAPARPAAVKAASPIVSQPQSAPAKDLDLAPPIAGSRAVDPAKVVIQARRDRAAARQLSGRGAGLVELIDQLSADSGEGESAEPKKQRARVSDPLPPMAPAARTDLSAFSLSQAVGNSYSGCLLGIHEGIAYGWVRNEERPDEVVDIEVTLDSGRPRVVRAGETLLTVLPMPSEIRNHGFAVPIWQGWRSILGRWQSGRLKLVVRSSKTPIVDLSLHANARDLEKGGYDGYCDLVDSMVRGWVWQPANPDKAVEVAVFVDGRFLARSLAAGAREDLRLAHIGNGEYGFSIPLPRSLRDGTPRLVEVVVAEAGLLLKRGRLRLIGDRLAVAD